MTDVLAGVRVVDLSWGFAGALASLTLADYGAEVVRVEPPEGDVLRSQPAFPLWGRNKHSTLLDLHEPNDLRAAQELAAGADVVVSTFRPRTAERLGLDWESLRAANPRLVYASITGFGSRGPLADVKGYEGVVMAKLGALDHIAGMAPRRGPAFAAVPFASFGAAHLAVQGILAALYVREHTQVGQLVETSLVQGLAAHDPWNWFLYLLAQKYPGGYVAQRPYPESGIPSSGFAFRLLVCLTADGHWLQFSQTSPHLFREFIEVLGLAHIWDDPHWSGAPDFESEERRREFWELLLEAARRRTLAEWEELFRSRPNVWAELFRSTSELLDHPQMRHNGHVVNVDDPLVGPTEQLAPFALLSRTPGRVRTPARPLGVRGATALAPSRASTPAVSPSPPSPPLSGVTLLELGTFYAAPFGPTLLADLGARVIKIEPLEGDPMRWLLPVPDVGAIKATQGKESVAVDLSNPQAREIILRLARRSDLVLMSFRAGVARKLGVDYETLRKESPRLVYLNAPGYGVDGPCARRPAYAPTIGAAAGLGRYQAGPSIPGGAALDLAQIKAASVRLGFSAQAPGNADGCAALGVATAFLLGLLSRARFGAGQEILTSMLGTTAYAVSDDGIRYAGRAPRPVPDEGLHGFAPLYRLYAASDGWVFLACPKPGEWPKLCRVMSNDVALLDDPRFAAPADRCRNSSELATRLETVFRRHTAADWETLCLEHDVACVAVAPGPIERQIMSHPLMDENAFLTEVEHPVYGPHRRLAPLVRLSATPGVARPACTLGQHTEAVLRELDFSAGEIADLASRKVVRLAGG